VPEAPKWVFWSTRDSINNDIPSITAIIETALAVPIYWWIAIHFETYLPLLISIVVAPLVLLRSDESVALGVRWFEQWENTYWERREHADQPELGLRRLVMIAAGLELLIFLFTPYLVPSFLIPNFEGHKIFWSGFVIGIISAIPLLASVATTRRIMTTSYALWMVACVPALVVITSARGGLMAGMGAATAIVLQVAAWQILIWAHEKKVGAVARAMLTISFILPGLGMSLGVFIFSLLIRVAATLRYICPGVRSLPRNFRRLILCTSPRQEPELVPGLSEATQFKLSSQLQYFRFAHGTNDVFDRVRAYLITLPAMLILFIPGWLYRVTLKSTALFWWPLAFLGGDLKQAKNPTLFHWKIRRSLWAKTSIALSIATIVSFIIANLVLTGAVLHNNPLLTLFGYFLLVDWNLRPWQVLTVVIAALSIGIVYWVDDVGGDFSYARQQQDNELLTRAERRFGWIERLTRLRLVLVVVLWVMVGAQALLYFNSFGCWFNMPPNVQSWAQWVYGDRLPESRCSSGRAQET